MQTQNYAGALAASQSASMEAIAMTLRSMGQVCDMGLTVAQIMLRSLARAATAFGLPDLSDAVAPPDDRNSHVFSKGAEQWVAGAQKAVDDGAELQRRLGETIEAQSATVTEQLQSGMEELAAQTRDGLQRLQDSAQEASAQAAEAADSWAQSISPEQNGVAPEQNGEPAGPQAARASRRAG